MAVNIDGLLQTILQSLSAPPNFDADFAARENYLRDQFEKRDMPAFNRSLTARGLHPSSGLAVKALGEYKDRALTPQIDALTPMRLAAMNQYRNGLAGLLPALLAFSQRGEAPAASSGGSGGFAAPPGVSIGSITNPDSLNSWDHLPTGYPQAAFNAGMGPNTVLNNQMGNPAVQSRTPITYETRQDVANRLGHEWFGYKPQSGIGY